MTAPVYSMDKIKISNVEEMYANKFTYRQMNALSFVSVINT
ncbi:Uncharacterized protein BWGO95_03521 [Bacillus mycoides]|uniref:Uncharacterized protein n=1 Tax=Bacillus mycoides TaxID=1405 RepID=A0A1C4EF47_BACMY|nr:Uncharacterized protein BWGO95_03521 [Bacillus mycoides]SCC42236.1 Uncharacterized protein BW664_03425 [Bacillus mycoides]